MGRSHRPWWRRRFGFRFGIAGLTEGIFDGEEFRRTRIIVGVFRLLVNLPNKIGLNRDLEWRCNSHLRAHLAPAALCTWPLYCMLAATVPCRPLRRRHRLAPSSDTDPCTPSARCCKCCGIAAGTLAHCWRPDGGWPAHRPTHGRTSSVWMLENCNPVRFPRDHFVQTLTRCSVAPLKLACR